jgi:hypothetical protein
MLTKALGTVFEALCIVQLLPAYSRAADNEVPDEVTNDDQLMQC